MKPEPWWPLKFDGPGHFIYPTAVIGEHHPAVYSVVKRSEIPIYAIVRNLQNKPMYCDDLLELRTRLLSLAYPEGKDET